MADYRHICDYLEDWQDEQEQTGLLKNPPPDNEETGRALAKEQEGLVRPMVWRLVGFAVSLRLGLQLFTGHGPGWGTYLVELLWVWWAFTSWSRRVRLFRWGREYTHEVRVILASKGMFPMFWRPYCLLHFPLCLFITVSRAVGSTWLSWATQDIPAIHISQYTVASLLCMIFGVFILDSGMSDPPEFKVDEDYSRQFLKGTDCYAYAAQEWQQHLRDYPREGVEE